MSLIGVGLEFLESTEKGRALFVLDTISSTKVFQEEHDGHFPNHLGASNPHSWQKKALFCFDIIIKSKLKLSIECNCFHANY